MKKVYVTPQAACHLMEVEQPIASSAVTAVGFNRDETYEGAFHAKSKDSGLWDTCEEE